MIIISEKNPNSINLAIKYLKQGKIIVLPTDTVYGVAVDASNYKAVSNLYKIKNRDTKKPIAIFVKNISIAKKIFYFNSFAKKIINKYLPGALTIILRVRYNSHKFLAKNLNKIDKNFLGLRVIDSYFVKNLFEKYNGVLAVTSANTSGNEVAKNIKEIKKYFPNIDLIVAGTIKSNTASTVVKISSEGFEVIRSGAIIPNPIFKSFKKN